MLKPHTFKTAFKTCLPGEHICCGEEYLRTTAHIKRTRQESKAALKIYFLTAHCSN